MLSPKQVYSPEHERASVDPRIPLYVFTGASNPAKIAAMQNVSDAFRDGDAGALIVTGPESWAAMEVLSKEIIAPDMIRCPDGQIACFAGADIRYALYQLHLRKVGLLEPRIDYNIVLIDLDVEYHLRELAASVLNDDRIDASYRLARIIAVVPERSCDAQLDHAERARIAAADTVFISGSESTRTEDHQSAEHIAAALNPLASIVYSDRFNLHLGKPWRVPLGGFRKNDVPSITSQTGMILLNDDGRPAFCLTSNLYNDARRNHADTATLRALRMVIAGQMDLPRFCLVLNDLIHAYGQQLLRLSAIVNAKHSERPMAFDVIGGILVRPAYASNSTMESSDICIAAPGLDAKETFRIFSDCVLPASNAGPPMEAVF